MSRYDENQITLSLDDVVYLMQLASKNAKFAAILNKINADVDFVVDMYTELDEEEE